MARRMLIDPEAQAEFDDAAAYYRSCLEGLDRRFAKAVRKQFRFIARHPDAGRHFDSGARSSRVADFPYVVVYFVSPAAIRIISIFHCSRDPAEWQRRV